jgi:S-formylglutathione hydrolase FrmB
MAFCELHYFSTALGMHTAANVFVPEGKDGPFPVLYLLHGLSDDHTIWQRRTRLENYLDGLPLMVVMPNGGRGFYTDAEQGFAYESAIVQDLVPFIDSVFQTRAERGGRCIGGLSMGGYGAMKLALKYPELFGSAHSHSGAVDIASRFAQRDEGTGDINWLREWTPVFGAAPTGGPNDCFALAEKCDTSQRPALRIDCGVDDFLIQHNRDFHAQLEKLGYAHEYEEFPGAHNWEYWDLHIREALAFHARHLGIEK